MSLAKIYMTKRSSRSAPTATRAAQRAAVLAAVSYRGNAELVPNPKTYRTEVEQLSCWLDEVDATEELEPRERALLRTPIGALDCALARSSSWRIEGVAALAWALQCFALPPYDQEVTPLEVLDAIGFLRTRRDAVCHSPQLRQASEIEERAELMWTIHWRLIEFEQRPRKLNLRNVRFSWGRLYLDDLSLGDGDLKISGRAIAVADEAAVQQCMSIAIERRRAFCWLCGDAKRYSRVRLDT